MDDYKMSLTLILKEYTLYFLCSITLIEFSLMVLFLFQNNPLFALLDGIGACMNVLVFIYIYRLPFKKIKPFINLYLFFLSIHIYFFTIIYWKHSIISFSWLLLIPIGILNIYSFRVIIYWTIYILFLITLAIAVPDIFGLREKYLISEDHILLINIVVVFFVLYLVFLILYFNNKILTLQLSQIPEPKTNNVEVEDFGNNEKYLELYHRIILAFEKEKPYLSSDFNISQLAISLNSNSTYISKAINTFTGTNFNAFINTYRIKKAKELLDNNDLNKFTLAHVYTLAGFKHQSTFNKAFKQIEGMSPTQYLQQNQF